MLPAPAVKWWHLVATVASGAVALCPRDNGGAQAEFEL